MQVLVVLDGRDDSTVRLRRALEIAGCQIATAAGPRDAEHRAVAQPVAAVIFSATAATDELLSRLRTRRPALPLIAWLSTSSSSRTAELFGSGADEVLHGAMGEPELSARTLAAIARGGSARTAVVEVGPLRIDPVRGEAAWHERELPLTGREREVLLALAETPGRALRREVIYRRVWGYTMARGDRTVDVNIRRLRAKLSAAAGDELAIQTQTGIGYRLQVGAATEPVTSL